jgi:hypothetical protein
MSSKNRSRSQVSAAPRARDSVVPAAPPVIAAPPTPPAQTPARTIRAAQPSAAVAPAQANRKTPASDAGSSPADGLPEELIAMRAYEIWQQRGCPMGQDSEDWFAAKEELEEQRLGYAAPTPEDRERGEH